MTDANTRSSGAGRRWERLGLLALAAAAVVLVAALAGDRPGGPGGMCVAAPPPADGGIPDSGAQRQAMIKAIEITNQKLDVTNQKLDRIVSLLESGKIAVVLSGPGAEKVSGDANKQPK